MKYATAASDVASTSAGPRSSRLRSSAPDTNSVRKKPTSRAAATKPPSPSARMNMLWA